MPAPAPRPVLPLPALLAVASATARAALEALERPDSGRLVGPMHPAGRSAKDDVTEGLEVVRMMALAARPHADPAPVTPEELRALALELRTRPLGAPVAGRRLRVLVEALDLACGGLEALAGLVHADSLRPAVAAGEAAP